MTSLLFEDVPAKLKRLTPGGSPGRPGKNRAFHLIDGNSLDFRKPSGDKGFPHWGRWCSLSSNKFYDTMNFMKKPHRALSPSGLLRVYFDGLCPLCSREIEHYRKRDTDSRVEWVDITRPGFDAKREGLDPDAVHRVFHVRTSEGLLISGVDAFIEIWKTIPSLNSWVRVARAPGARLLMKLGYSGFVRLRPYLPRRRRDECDTGVCEPLKKGLS